MSLSKKIIIFILAIFFNSLGIALSTRANLGTTPISSLPYVITFMTPLSFGMTTFLVNVAFIFTQMIILKKDFKKTDFFQLIIALVFGLFIDIGMYLTAPFVTDKYILKLLMLVIGSMILAFGVSLEVYANLIYVPGEGVVRAFSSRYGKDFGKIKVGFDVALCALSIMLSLMVLGKIQGLREGTVISAILVGTFVCLYKRCKNALMK